MKKAMGLVVLAGVAGVASADITQVFDPSGLNQGPYTVEDFESWPGQQPGATYSASTGVLQADAGGFAGGGTPSGQFGLSTGSFPDPITVTFDQPASSVGLWFGNDDTCCSSGFTAFLDIFGSNGLLGTIGVDANMNDFADQFLGFNSTESVTSVTIRFGTGTDVGLFHYIDDVYFNVVPAPAGVALGGLGLLAMGRRRR